MDQSVADTLFRNARTPDSWTGAPVEEETLRTLYDLLRDGPTSGNCCPARFVFLTTQDAKERLKPALSAGNIDKAVTAAAIVIVAWDPLFFDILPRLGADPEIRSWFASDIGLAEETAMLNSTLQGAWLIMAARSLGLDVLPLSGFDAQTVEDTFLRNDGWKANFLVCLGHGNPPAAPRAPRLSFEEACRVL